ncbi:MAG: hypothetical protein R6V03_11290 [Kiritimatiellia bacterium]
MNHRFVPLFVLGAALLVFLLIPLRIVSMGFLPADDVMRHSAKVVSGRDWSDILILREDIETDSHPGWHSVLRAVHSLTRDGPEPLAVFSMTALFLVACALPALSMKRPEAWMIALLTAVSARPGWTMRLMLGRPFLVSVAVLLVICLSARRLESRRSPWALLTALTAGMTAATWMHCSWYLFALPLICFVAARRFRSALRLGIVLALGAILGAALTGHPLMLLTQSVVHGLRALGHAPDQAVLAEEFQSSPPDIAVAIIVLMVAGWRTATGRVHAGQLSRDPVLWLAGTGWILGQYVSRFWSDWGMPAAIIWISLVVHDELESRTNRFSPARAITAVLAAGALYVSTTADFSRRWTRSTRLSFLSADNPGMAEALPGEGGVFYNTNMTLFYTTFYANPKANWRYVAGFEPTMMPEELLRTYRAIRLTGGNSPAAYAPLVERMTPEDCLALGPGCSRPPHVPGLKWISPARGYWIGKIPDRE